MESAIEFDPNLGTLKQQITTAKQDYLSKATDKYMAYADVFNAAMSSTILNAVNNGQADTSYTVNIFDYSIPESRKFSEFEKANCPQEFYDAITAYFDAQGITATITPTGPIVNNTIEFSWN